ncbi:MAG: transposase family protein [Planctomycetota bacterium]|nr:transposase family protein [Planctomycetota bacterium]
MKLFSVVPDTSKNRHLVKYCPFDMIFIAISASVSDVDDWQTIVLWAKTQEEWLRKYCELENGIPSWWTFRRVFRKGRAHTVNGHDFPDPAVPRALSIRDL